MKNGYYLLFSNGWVDVIWVKDDKYIDFNGLGGEVSGFSDDTKFFPLDPCVGKEILVSGMTIKKNFYHNQYDSLEREKYNSDCKWQENRIEENLKEVLQ